jgi:ANTAR domain
MGERAPDRWEQLLRAAAQESSSQPRRIAEMCVEMLDISGAGISLVSDTGVRGVVCATDDVALHIEELQLTLGEGPCVDAVGRGGPVLVPDLEDRADLATERWPGFMSAATEAGVRAVFAFPLRIGAINLGALDLYRTWAGALSEEQLSGALLAAEGAGVALLSLHTTDDGGLVDDESTPGGYQAQVHQGTGMIMVQAGVDIEQAFLLLRARAFASGRPIQDVAADVVAHRIRFDAEDG